MAWRLAAYLKRTACPVDEPTIQECQALAARMGIRVPVVLCSPFVASPLLIGLCRPAILLPEEEKVDARCREILVHELAHLARGDCFWNFLGRLSTAVLFFQPFLWILVRRLAASAEEVCDDYVVHICTDRSAYARRLVEIAKQYQPQPAAGVGVISLRSFVGRRIERILDSSRKISIRLGRRAVISVWATSLAVTCLMGLLNFSGKQVAAVAADEKIQSGADAKASQVKSDAMSKNSINDSMSVVEGRVVDTAGKPIAGANVAVRAVRNTIWKKQPKEIFGQTTTDKSGNFRMSVPAIHAAEYQTPDIVAMADGYGVNEAILKRDAPYQKVIVKLEAEGPPVIGRLVDPDGKPAAGVEVELKNFYTLLNDPNAKNYPGGVKTAAWPATAKSDDQGRFSFHGIGRDVPHPMRISVEVDDPRYAPQEFRLDIDGTKVPEAKLSPARIINGVVTHEDTGTPIAEAGVCIDTTTDYELFSGRPEAGIKTDAQGRFQLRPRLQPRAGKVFQVFQVFVYPPAGEPYPAWTQTFPNKGTQTNMDVKIEVPRGVLVRGKITEAGSGKPIAGAGVEYEIREHNNPNYHEEVHWANMHHRIPTDKNGNFEMAVMPGPGYLLVKAPTPEFIHQEITHGELERDVPGGQSSYPDGFVKIDPKPNSEPLETAIELQRGVTIQGRVVDPQGNPVKKAALLSSSYQTGYFDYHGEKILIEDGKFELPGCDPSKPQQVFFFDAERQLGAVAELDAVKAQTEPPVIRMEPCGSATVRLVDAKGKPYANQDNYENHLIFLVLMIAPGEPKSSVFSENHSMVYVIMDNLDRNRYYGLKTDADGRVTFPSLIPNATYWIDNALDLKQEFTNKFSVKPGENIDLGDVVVPRPDEANTTNIE
jgi:protocatechuate 3,4-dioxygenase beta subunit